jgi:MGT family glycosyltransferase
MVGPSGWDPAEDEPEPRWLAALTRPVILVSISTVFQDDGKLIQAALDALAGEPYDVVATTASLDPGSFRRPDNAHLHRFVPHSHVLRRAVAVVSPGGMGLTQKALLAGVPMCVVPFGRDQLEVARRVLESGAGTRVSSARLTPRRLRSAILEAIECTPAARRVGEQLWRAGGAPAAADALEQLTARRKPGQPAAPH